MNDLIDGEINENSLEWAVKFRKYLLHEVGTIVYVKSDIKRKCPMTIYRVRACDDHADYSCKWLDSQHTLKQCDFWQKELMI